jgi:hypothetical protein
VVAAGAKNLELLMSRESKHWWLGLLLFVCFFLLVASLVSSLWPVASLYFELFPFLMQ